MGSCVEAFLGCVPREVAVPGLLVFPQVVVSLGGWFPVYSGPVLGSGPCGSRCPIVCSRVLLLGPWGAWVFPGGSVF